MKTGKNNHKTGRATSILLNNTRGGGAGIVRVSRINKGHVSRMIRGLRPLSRTLMEATGQALLNLSARLQIVAIQHEAGEHA
jgi:hypothetical protein